MEVLVAPAVGGDALPMAKDVPVVNPRGCVTLHSAPNGSDTVVQGGDLAHLAEGLGSDRYRRVLNSTEAGKVPNEFEVLKWAAKAPEGSPFYVDVDQVRRLFSPERKPIGVSIKLVEGGGIAYVWFNQAKVTITGHAHGREKVLSLVKSWTGPWSRGTGRRAARTTDGLPQLPAPGDL